MTERLERPVDAGRQGRRPRAAAGADDDDMVVVADAQPADQRRRLFGRRQHRRHAVAHDPPPVAVKARMDRAGDMPSLESPRARTHIKDDDPLVACVFGNPFRVHQRAGTGGGQGGKQRPDREDAETKHGTPSRNVAPLHFTPPARRGANRRREPVAVVSGSVSARPSPCPLQKRRFRAMRPPKSSAPVT